jgi:hypothetical protein
MVAMWGLMGWKGSEGGWAARSGFLGSEFGCCENLVESSFRHGDGVLMRGSMDRGDILIHLIGGVGNFGGEERGVRVLWHFRGRACLFGYPLRLCGAVIKISFG